MRGGISPAEKLDPTAHPDAGTWDRGEAGGAPEMAFLYSEPEESPASAEQPREIEFRDHPAIAALNEVSAELMILIGPMLWAALIVLFIWAELFTR